MRILIISILTTVFFFSCNVREKKEHCIYSLEKLFIDYDTSIIDKGFFDTGEMFEASDKGSDIGAKGLYRFDHNNRLRFYAFLLTDKNDYTFSIEYDSLGFETKKTEKQVVHWYFRSVGSDSFRVTFYLFSLNHEYDNIQLSISKNSFQKVELFNSPIFSNMLGGTFTYPAVKTTANIFIKGVEKNLCLNKSIVFNDSIPVPDEFLRPADGPIRP